VNFGTPVTTASRIPTAMAYPIIVLLVSAAVLTIVIMAWNAPR